MDFIHDAFQKTINEVPVVSAFFYAMAGLCALLVMIDFMRTYSEIMVEGKTEPWKIIKPIAVILLIVMWKPIYYGLNTGFDSIEFYFNDFLIKKITKEDGKIINQLFLDIGTDSKFSLFEVSMGSFMMAILAFMLGFIHWLLDLVVTLWLNINDLIIALFAPVAVVLTLLKESSSAFMTWLRLFAKFRIFMLAVICCDFLGLVFTRYVKESTAKSMDIPADMMALAGVSNMLNIICLSAFIVFKILFLIASYKLLSSIFESGDLSVGAATGGMAKGLTQIITKVASKGAA